MCVCVCVCVCACMCVCVCVAKPVAVEIRCHATALILFNRSAKMSRAGSHTVSEIKIVQDTMRNSLS